MQTRSSIVLARRIGTPKQPSENTLHEVFPYLRVADTVAAMRFYAQAYGAVEKLRLTEPSGRIGHAEMQLGAGVLMLSDAFPEYGLTAPARDADIGCSVHLHVDDADAMAAREKVSPQEMQRRYDAMFE